MLPVLLYLASMIWLVHRLCCFCSSFSPSACIPFICYACSTILWPCWPCIYACTCCAAGNGALHASRTRACLNTNRRIALSVKMNVLLYLPGLMVVLFRAWGAWRTVVSLVIIVGGTQGLLGLPFLLHDPFAYLKGSFDFSRVFLYEWTVNWRFLDEKTFLSASFSHLLLSLHLLLLLLFGLCQWTGISRQGWRWISLRWCGDSVPMSPFCKSRV